MSPVRAGCHWLRCQLGRPAGLARLPERLPPGTRRHLLRDLGLDAGGGAFPCRHAARCGAGRPYRLGLRA